MLQLFNKKVAWLVLIVLAVFLGASASLLPGLRFDYDFEHYFPVGDPDYKLYRDHIEKFETDNDFLLIGIKREAGLFDSDFLLRVEALTDSLSKVENVEQVLSPTTIRNPIIGPFGVISPKYLHPDKPDNLTKDSVRIYENPELIGSLFSLDAKSLALLVRHIPSKDRKLKDKLTETVQVTTEYYGFDEVHVAGKIKSQYYFISKMERELVYLIISSILLLFLFLYYSFRSAWGIFVPLMVVGSTIAVMLGFMVLVGKPIDLMSTIMPTILFVVGISNVIHIVEKYLEELRKGNPKIRALVIAFRDVGLATILTAITTAIGFLSLTTSSIVLVQEFGVFVAIGVFVALVLSFSFLPSSLILLKKPRIARKSIDELFWTRRLHKVMLWIIPRRKKVLIWSLSIFGLSLIGLSLVKVDNSLLGDYATDEEFISDYRFFEEEFSGFRPFELSVWVTDSNKSLLDADCLAELEKLDGYLRTEYGAGFLVSPLTFIKSTNKAMNGGKQEFYAVPDNGKTLKRVRKNVKRLPRANLRTFLSDDQRTGRFSGKVEDIGGYKMRSKNADFDAFVHENISPVIGLRLTGMPHLIDKNNDSLAGNIMNGLFLAFTLIAIIMGLLFRSWKIILISLLPNVLPLVMIAAIMGLTGIDLKISTSIIFTIVFGIAVDDTIHFMSKFRIELGKGKNTLYALKRTYLSTGKAIMVTTMILCGGFMTLLFSDIASTFYIGLLISMTLFFAVLADLLFLPVLLMLFYRK